MLHKILKNCRLPTGILIVLITSSACGLIYKQNIQQGNALEQDDIDELYIGMNKRQVSFVLGSPSVHDPFNQQRWDYVQTFSRRGNEMIQRTVTLHFEEDLLSEIIGADQGISAGENVERDEANAAKNGDQDGDIDSSDPNAVSIEAAEEEVMEPEIQGLGERSAEDRELEEDMEVLQQRSPDDLTSPDIDG
jgi:outer membrane protein assembly factor BamE